MSYKKRLIILVCSFFIYIIVVNICNKFDNDLYEEALVLKTDILRGEELKLENFEKVYIKSKNNVLSGNFVLSQDLENFVCNEDLNKGSLLLKDNLIAKSQYNKVEDGYEIISIKIANPDDIVSYQIEKNNVVNLYYTGKISLNDSILNDMDVPYIMTQTNNIGKVDSGYVTIKLIENIKIIDLFDKYGNAIDSKSYIKNESNKIDTIMFEVSKDLVLKINNLKNYGQFSISVVK